MYILVENTTTGFKPTEYGPDPYRLCSGIEYEDILRAEIQIWEHPSGAIFAVKPDREVSDKHIYSLPSKELWTPTLEQLAVDKEKVENAYLYLTKKATSRDSFLKRLTKVFKK